MVLQLPVKREPFCPPVREPLFDPGAEDRETTAPSPAVEAASDTVRDAAIPADTAQSEGPRHNHAERAIADGQSAADQGLLATDVPVKAVEPAPEPLVAEAGGGESVGESSPPDDFGAGLGSE
jgi:hypothetical protein